MKHLIHIGYPKAASTFLQEWFRQNPQIYYQPGALAGYRDVYEICSRGAAAAQAGAAGGGATADFKYYVTSCEGLVMPRPQSGRYPIEYGKVGQYLGASYYEPQKRVCRILKDIYPGSLILIVTRGFKSFVLSGYSQYAKAGGTFSFENLIRVYQQNALAAAINSDLLLDYDYVYKLYAESFGEENLVVLPFELLRDDKKKFISVIEERLGLRHFEDNIGRVNESLSSEELYWYPRISHRVSKLAIKLGSRGYAGFYGWYIHQTINHRLKKLALVLSRLRRIEKIDESIIPQAFLEQCRGKASVFRNNPLYAPYRAEYFLDE